MSKFIIVLFLLSFSLSAQEKVMDNIPNKNITIEQLDEMFSSITEQGQWDLSQPLLWGYFFTDNDPNKLELAMPKIQAMGYSVVGIFQAEKEEENEPDLFYLHVEKPEIHNSKSLDKRNDEFYIFAYQNGLDSYDGMDVGPVAQ
ncbi:hypothetical protein GCM10008107_31500 [Psychrosphaera saromensis]|nr:hypothetical protein GCM10008107_31500 [Psychrosphaera saromensis]GLQ12762.1 hypothetical protein GCM10007917_02170 [Psychrosphaera saromensis]